MSIRRGEAPPYEHVAHIKNGARGEFFLGGGAVIGSYFFMKTG